MQASCPDARLVKEARLRDYRLLFRGQDRGYATLLPSVGSEVPVIIWEIPTGHIAKLDEYEEYPSLYNRSEIMVDGLACFYYWILPAYPKAKPDEAYVALIRRVYEDRGWSQSPLADALV